MNPELQRETTFHDIELPAACLTCGGPISARFTPGSARGVCLACHALVAMAVARDGDGLRVVSLPAAAA